MLFPSSQGNVSNIELTGTPITTSEGNMTLGHELVEKFQALHLAKYGERITYDAAELRLHQLAELVRITAQKE